MNREKLHQIFEAYIEKFEYLNNSYNNESYKWSSICEFQRAFNLDAPTDGFASMLKEARDATHNIIDNYTQPFSGLVELAKKEPDAVRAMLVALMEDDGGDLEARQEKIDIFLEACDRLIEEYFPGSHLYKNDQRSAMAYLFFNDPDSHYLYKATEAKALADSVGFYDDWGTMTAFHLDIYYRFCKELIEEIRAYAPLMEIHKSRFAEATSPMHEDESLHVLAFDVIYCASTYNLYDGIAIDKVTAADRRLYQERKEKARVLLAVLHAAEAEAQQLEDAKAYFTEALAPGTTVSHKTFGPAEVMSLDRGTLQLEVQKTGEIKRFGFLFSIASGFITIGTDEFAEQVAKYKSVMLQEMNIPNRLKDAKKNMETYKQYID